jgi:hypothetical protein
VLFKRTLLSCQTLAVSGGADINRPSAGKQIMGHKFSITFLVLTITSIFCSCGDTFNKFMCGEPEGKQKLFIDSINSTYKDELTLRHMPCYNDYMRIDLKTNYDKLLVDSLEQAYERTVWWAEFHVYDKYGKLIRGNTGSM